MSKTKAVQALNRIGFLLERTREPTFRVQAFRKAAAAIDALPEEEVARRATTGTLEQLPGIGAVTAKVITEALSGEVPSYLKKLEGEATDPLVKGGDELRAQLKGDCHVHSNWSDGGSPIKEMAEAAKELGHEYIVLTDHSPRLTIAKGLSPERLRKQLDVVAELNEELKPFRILTGIEVDINEDGTLDQQDELLDRLDIVVASVHSKLRMPSEAMTPRMIKAISNPHTDILGHCTGRIVVGRGRPESEFDADAVFEACKQYDVAVEINSRPERLDPPRRLLKQAVEMGCKVAIDTDAHAPGQLDWQPYGCGRAVECGVTKDMVVNALSKEELAAWASR